MAIETFQRQEIKFLLNEVQYQALTEQLEQYMNPDPYCVGGKDYGIYNIYYDTPDDYLIRTSLAKPYYKEKIRLRSYMSPAKPEDLVFLEIKKKIGGIVNKRRITLTLKEAEAYMQRGIHPVDNGKYVRRLVLEELDHFCDRYAPLVPKQYISYQRAAFFGKDDPNFRLTFDRQLTQRRTNLNLSSGDFGSLLIPETSHLMEVKIGGAMPIWLAQQLAALRIYKISFSKYGTAYRLYCTAEQQTKEKRNVSDVEFCFIIHWLVNWSKYQQCNVFPERYRFIFTGCQDDCCDAVFRGIGWVVDQLAIYHYAPEEWLLAELCYDAADFTADCGNCAEYD